MIKTYVINLETSKERKAYMDDVLKDLSTLDVEYVKAVDGRKMSLEEKNKYFDIKKFKERNSIEVRDGEIGCTLSHQKCYRKIVEENIPYALILEDDIEICGDLNKAISSVCGYLMTEEPTVILLSGWFWYISKKIISDNYRLATVYSAFLTHSYLINNSAAKLLIEKRPYIVADDWTYIKNKGVKIKAILPHIINQKNDGIESTITFFREKKVKSLLWRLKNARNIIFTKILKLIGNFEKPSLR
ncbi:glycosyltransferase family 25 protein [Bacteroides caecigallinarum]|uniref:glycosyltransferase family 25 protein n=1 Tax=Bacteroides caecigallinarum TaxID=1411144 RepID=UPI0019577AE5|nr:glycosyltransferase family 25 protein [Bacteroides caecigallinarum]MBM6866530.1 glycosyltransferase family 25 protein [Bacteroides caecigallinarum]